MSEVVQYSVRDHVATIVLNRPERLNAYNQALSEALIAALLTAEADSQVRAAVLTGSGRAFCAGLDLKDVNKDPAKEVGTDVGNDIRSVFFNLNVPLIAAINGPAIGIGAEMAVLCDFRIMAEGSYLDDRHVQRGMVADVGATWLLPRLLGWSRACELLLLAEPIDAKTALAWGLAREVVDQSSLLSVAHDFARRFTRNAPAAMRATKRIMREGLTDDFLSNSRAARAENYDRLMKLNDFKEALSAFVERRPPAFNGD